VEFGVFHDFPRSAEGDDAEVFNRSFELVDAAERMGMDAMWLAEVHFSPDLAALSAPMIVASAIAARTSRMKLGSAVVVLPLCHPLRLAEEGATLDQVSRGRLIFGVGRSSFPQIYDVHGVSYAESRERFTEILDIVKLAWTHPRFSYEGSFYRYHDIAVVPKPYQKPHPPIRVAASSPDTFALIGRLGHAIFVNVRQGTFSDLGPSIRAYRDAYRSAGHDGNGEVYLRLPIYVAGTYERARDEPEESVMRLLRFVGGRLEASANRCDTNAIEQRVELGHQLQTMSYDDALRQKMVVGTPAMVADRLEGLRDELGLDGILAELNSGGRIPHDRVLNSLRLLCDEVMPRFK
jgi:alkanesulfonate monooxygenase SsuD/methylene tetrahydromethanopterin reductase-like flavin-dependent oxidoreductase (luciferase family)